MIFTNESDGRSTDAGSTKLGYMQHFSGTFTEHHKKVKMYQ